MLVLAADTSSLEGSVAILSDGNLQGEIRLASSMRHSETLFGSIDFLLRNLGLAIGEIDLFAAARGPGSFTGLRVGLAAMAGFAFANARPSAGISTLAALAWQVGETTEMVSPMLDARRQEAYCGLFRRKGDELVEQERPVVMPPAEWISRMESESVVFCGTGALDTHFAGTSGPKMCSVDPYLAHTIGLMAVTSNVEPLEPLYIRPSDAEIERRRVP